MSVLVFGSLCASAVGCVSRRVYRFAEQVDLPHPYCEHHDDRDDQAWVCLRESADRAVSLVIALSAVEDTPIFLVVRPLAVNADVIATEVVTLRAKIDGSWRGRARHTVESVCDPLAPTRLRFDLALAVPGIALPAVRYCAALPAAAKRIRRIQSRSVKGGVNMHMKEVLDWVFYIRVAAGRNIGVSLTQRVLELGGSLRSFRRLCKRLRLWIAQPPCSVTPQMVIDALGRRLGGRAPPPPPPGDE